jgi:hypothetical protein
MKRAYLAKDPFSKERLELKKIKEKRSSRLLQRRLQSLKSLTNVLTGIRETGKDQA